MRIKYLQYEKEISLSAKESAYSILQILWINNALHDKALCAGVGKCGKCKIRFVSAPPSPTADEVKLLTQEEIDTHIRLSCKHSANEEIIIELLQSNASLEFFEVEKTHHNNLINTQNKSKNTNLSLAIDFGTTSLEYAFLANNKVQKNGSMLNPMHGIGSEVMARLHFAQNKEQAHALYTHTWECIENIISENGFTPDDIDIMTFAGNSAMTYLALEKDSNSLAFAPYSLTYTGGKTEEIKNYFLPPVYIPPLIAPFVGGDISAGIYALEKTILEKSERMYPYFYIDMGTNAEFALVLSENEALVSSVPLGPSLEGVGLTFGTVANPSSIIDFKLTPSGLECLFLNNKTQSDISESDGICGVAYLHLLHLLKTTGLLGEDGHFIHNPSTPLAKKIANFATFNGESALELPYNFYLSAGDIENILKVKAAFCTAFGMLLKEANISLQSLQNIYLAGTFGKYIMLNTLCALGFLPLATRNIIEQVGNTSLEGAKLLIKTDAQNEISTMFKNYKHIELSNSDEFQQLYIENFNFKGK